jgi:hypothetical protein
MMVVTPTPQLIHRGKGTGIRRKRHGMHDTSVICRTAYLYERLYRRCPTVIPTQGAPNINLPDDSSSDILISSRPTVEAV